MTNAQDTPIEINDEKLDIEGILQAIRIQILQRREKASTEGIDFDALARGTGSIPDAVRFPPSLHESMFQAEMLRDKTQVSLFVTARPMPIIGGLIQRLRTGLHQIAVFYVNIAAQRQIAFNVEVARSLTQLVSTLEAEQKSESAADASIAQMREEIDYLKRRVEELEHQS
ncbi:MAG: hypothetical protein NTZ50_05685 [Chloroflexi bacterium]|nr:hypothetical protein [Chloroflexota bacterium]